MPQPLLTNPVDHFIGPQPISVGIAHVVGLSQPLPRKIETVPEQVGIDILTFPLHFENESLK